MPSNATAIARKLSRLITWRAIRDRQVATNVSTRPRYGWDAGMAASSRIVDDYRNFRRGRVETDFPRRPTGWNR